MKLDYADISSDTESKSSASKDLALVLGYEGRCLGSRFTRPLTEQEQSGKSSYSDYVSWSESMKEALARPYCIASAAMRAHVSGEEPWIAVPANVDIEFSQETTHFAALANLYKTLVTQFEKAQFVNDDDISAYVLDRFLQFKEVEAIFYGKHLNENQYTILLDSAEYSEQIYDKLIDTELAILDRFDDRFIMMTFIWASKDEIIFNLPKSSVTLARRAEHG